MSRIAYVNGRYIKHSKAQVHIEDRGYQFSDGVYEVILVQNDKLIDEDAHHQRLQKSLKSLGINAPMKRGPLTQVINQVIKRNKFRNGIVYIQVTRGVAPREHSFPTNIKPSLVMTARRLPPKSLSVIEAGVKVIIVDDIRWKRCDIKTVSLLPNVLGKQKAREHGAYEAWMVDEDQLITEGTSTNAWIVSAEGTLITSELGSHILSGVTRKAFIQIATELNISYEERQFSVEEAENAREAFFTSSTSFLTPVTEINGKVIGNGKAGSLSLRLLNSYFDYIN
ncbi:D-amino-acid transaminase [Alphaproteobacteria bacterium]|nr:D-amino-acid transaminase [Alphaproteobacteria bacterium]